MISLPTSELLNQQALLEQVYLSLHCQIAIAKAKPYFALHRRQPPVREIEKCDRGSSSVKAIAPVKIKAPIV
jgi:hypothetical protein